MDKSTMNALVSSGSGLVSSVINGLWNNKLAKDQREWNEKMSDLEWERTLDMWNRTNEYNTPAAQKQRLLDAGLNPLFYGLDGSSATTMSAPQTLGYQRAEAPTIDNPVGTYLDAKAKQAQIDLLKSEEAKNRSETKGIDLDNQFLEDTLEAREYGEQLKNQLTGQQIGQIKDTRNKISKEIDLLVKQAKTEEEKAALTYWQKELARANAEQVAAMTPVMVELTKAQTEAQKASAVYNYVQAAYQQKMIDEGYIEGLCDKIYAETMKAWDDKETNAVLRQKYGADIRREDVETAAKEFENNLKTGNNPFGGKWFNEHPWAKSAWPGVAFLASDVWPVLDGISETAGKILGPVLGVAAGSAAGAATGAAVGKVSGKTVSKGIDGGAYDHSYRSEWFNGTTTQ